VKPSAVALGTAFNHIVSLAVLAPMFGDTYRRARAADTREEFVHSREAATAAATWGASLAGAALQSYGVGALINATGTLTYKGAAYLGGLIFLASAAPSVSVGWKRQEWSADWGRLLRRCSRRRDRWIPFPLGPWPRSWRRLG
jgi:hypothetical protein